MSSLELIIGNKRYSSWSMRPWIAMRTKDIAFTETLSAFDMSTMHQHYWEFSPTKKVPVLVHDGQTVWDSLAILEALNDLYPDKQLWPRARTARAHARSVSNEMHAGFPALRTLCPMNMARTPSPVPMTPELVADITRIEKIFADCLATYGGPFLFGEFSIADAMFAPVINRIEIYQLSDTDAVVAYSKVIKALPAWQTWETEGRQETWIVKEMEI